MDLMRKEWVPGDVARAQRAANLVSEQSPELQTSTDHASLVARTTWGGFVEPLDVSGKTVRVDTLCVIFLKG